MNQIAEENKVFGKIEEKDKEYTYSLIEKVNPN
jgi:hypothetical protein